MPPLCAGTPLGDPIEIGALGQALPGRRGSHPAAGDALALASNKACYGHTEGAAGLTGLLLAASMAGQAAAPAIMHFRHVNPYVQAALSDWASAGRALHLPRQAAPGPSARRGPAELSGTSSFGMSGVNAHMLVVPAVAAKAAEGSVLTQVGRCRPCPGSSVAIFGTFGTVTRLWCPLVLIG